MCSGSVRLRVFSATVLFVSWSTASYTTPMPPAPSLRDKLKRRVPKNSLAASAIEVRLAAWQREVIDRSAIVPYMNCAINILAGGTPGRSEHGLARVADNVWRYFFGRDGGQDPACGDDDGR